MPAGSAEGDFLQRPMFLMTFENRWSGDNGRGVRRWRDSIKSRPLCKTKGLNYEVTVNRFRP